MDNMQVIYMCPKCGRSSIHYSHIKAPTACKCGEQLCLSEPFDLEGESTPYKEEMIDNYGSEVFGSREKYCEASLKREKSKSLNLVEIGIFLMLLDFCVNFLFTGNGFSGFIESMTGWGFLLGAVYLLVRYIVFFIGLGIVISGIVRRNTAKKRFGSHIQNNIGNKL